MKLACELHFRCASTLTISIKTAIKSKNRNTYHNCLIILKATLYFKHNLIKIASTLKWIKMWYSIFGIYIGDLRKLKINIIVLSLSIEFNIWNSIVFTTEVQYSYEKVWESECLLKWNFGQTSYGPLKVPVLLTRVKLWP